jgi:integrase
VSRSLHRLSSAKVDKAKPKKLPDGTLRVKLYPDGGGLYLQVTPLKDARIAKSWIFRFTAARGKERYMGLGPFDVVGLADAREKAAECRKLRYDGVDPIEAKRTQRACVATQQAKTMTFDQCAEAYMAAHLASWRHPGHAKQWKQSLANYVSPVFGSLPVQAIDVALVMKIIEPMWATKSETAARVRGRIELILDWAAARGLRDADNPARWKGRLENLLPRRTKVHTVQHYAALPYDKIPGFMSDLRGRQLLHAPTLEFTVLTAARTTEVLGAPWSEIDLTTRTWSIPANRMKGGKEHRVPLSDPAIAILERMKAKRENDYVFPGEHRAKGSHTALLLVLERMGRGDLTTHGFRSTFRDWAAERTDFPSWVVEMALAHAIGNGVEAAYRRGDLFEKRRQLMGAWSDFCG